MDFFVWQIQHNECDCSYLFLQKLRCSLLHYKCQICILSILYECRCHFTLCLSWEYLARRCQKDPTAEYSCVLMWLLVTEPGGHWCCCQLNVLTNTVKHIKYDVHTDMSWHLAVGLGAIRQGSSSCLQSLNSLRLHHVKVMGAFRVPESFTYSIYEHQYMLLNKPLVNIFTTMFKNQTINGSFLLPPFHIVFCSLQDRCLQPFPQKVSPVSSISPAHVFDSHVCVIKRVQ